MNLQVYLLLPDTPDLILQVAEQEQGRWSILEDIVSLLKFLRDRQDIDIYYDNNNIQAFLELSKEMVGETYLHKPKSQLQNLLGKSSQNLREVIKKQPDCIYLWWRIDDISVNYAHTVLSEIAERIFTYPSGKYLLLNIRKLISTTQSFITIFKDAQHIHALPDRFARIPYVIDKEELEIWLATYYASSFNLFDRNRFRKTQFMVQGKPVFEEVDTGRFWYLDNFHKLDHDEIEIPRHYEVFNSQRQHLGIADLQGNLDTSKRDSGRTFSG